ncbi:hypothetical protein KIW84_057234 [Lathyrus oleraceus]|uniref:DUF7745 domain-containing protein n=1 Tax=Pisum sativum TaxID=3888 RepID=A0A9D4X0F8_PEA|nr:hypothetical protein KIW84_057234 [Pisum sativum]
MESFVSTVVLHSKDDEFRILSLLTVKVQTSFITALAQFYDPLLRSFLLQDFHLTLTLEEFKGFLGFSMKGRIPYNMIGQVPKVEKLSLALQNPIPTIMTNWNKRHSLSGFQRVYLEGEAKRLLVSRDWDVIGNVLALLIYGQVLFQTYEGFIDSTAISIFWAMWKENKSTVYLLLADVFYSLHHRHEKKSGILTFCLPLLYKWLTSHVFISNTLISDMSSTNWAQTLVSLTERDITWYRSKLNGEEIIIICGSFPNVPLIGSKGCISYNPMLATRQFGYPMLGKYEDCELEEMILNDMDAKDPALLYKIVKSWEKIHNKFLELGKRDGVSRAKVARLGKENEELQLTLQQP